MIALENVLVATDFGEASAVALKYGRDLARTFHATLHLLHVLDDLESRAATMAGYGIDFAKVQSDMQASVRRDLDALLSDEDRQQLGAKAVIVTSTMPAQAIVQYANETKANLIVLGTHGRNTVAHFFIGSVAERVVRTASCPVLTVRESEREFVLPDALQRVAHA